MEENEEFEFRLRAEQEAAAAPTAAAPVDPVKAARVKAAFDNAAANAPAETKEPSVIDKIGQGFMDTPVLGTVLNATAGLWNTGAKAVSGLAGLATGGNADVVRGVHDALSVQMPHSNDPVAKGLEALQRGAEFVSRPVDEAVAKLPDGARTLVEGAEEAIPDIANVVGMAPAARVGGAGIARAGRALGETTPELPPGPVQGAAKATTADPLGAARAAGFKFRPSDVKAVKPGEKVPGLKREALHEPAALKKDLTLENQAVATRLAAEDIGANNTKSLMASDYAKLREPHFKVYKDVEDATKIAPSEDYMRALGVAQQRAGLESSATATETIAALRRNATKRARSEDIKINQQGEADLKTAAALEDALEAQLTAQGDAKLIGDYRAARQSLAKIHDYETATRGGQIDPQVLRRLDKKNPGRMAGNMKLIADAADLAPNVVKHGRTATGVRSSVKADSLIESLPLGVGATVKGAKWLGDKMLMAVPGVDVRKSGFQRNFGREATPQERASFSDYGRRPERFAPIERPPFANLGAGSVDMAPGGPVTPPLANQLAGDLGLMPEPVPNAQLLPNAPPMFTADVVPPITTPDGVPFRASPELRHSLAGELGLADDAARSADVIDWTPPSMAPQLAGNEALALGLPDDLVAQLGLNVDTVQPSLMTPVAEPVPYGPRVQLERPPGRVGKPKRKK